MAGGGRGPARTAGCPAALPCPALPVSSARCGTLCLASRGVAVAQVSAGGEAAGYARRAGAEAGAGHGELGELPVPGASLPRSGLGPAGLRRAEVLAQATELRQLLVRCWVPGPESPPSSSCLFVPPLGKKLLSLSNGISFRVYVFHSPCSWCF